LQVTPILYQSQENFSTRQIGTIKRQEKPQIKEHGAWSRGQRVTRLL